MSKSKPPASLEHESVRMDASKPITWTCISLPDGIGTVLPRGAVQAAGGPHEETAGRWACWCRVLEGRPRNAAAQDLTAGERIPECGASPAAAVARSTFPLPLLFHCRAKTDVE